MSDTWRENAIVQAIELIVNKRISQASYDTTIKAFIEQIKDQTINEYIVKYQDSRLTVYGSGDAHYAVGDEVLIHVPGNDLTKTKTIMGTTTHLATVYKQIPQISNLYNKVGTNAIISMQQSSGQLSSYKTSLIPVTDIKIDEESIKKYVRQGNGLAIGMYVRTSLDDNQVGGKYGAIFNLKFKDAQGHAAVRPYIVSSRDVIGNPYGLTKETYVETLIDDIDINYFDGIDKVQLFVQDFPQDEAKASIKDIHINGLCIFGASVLTEKELDGYTLHIDYSTNGDTLSASTADPVISELKLIADFKVKGKTIKQNVLYYWFKENGRVFRNSTYGHYSSYGGDGWECLNPLITDEKVTTKTGYIGLSSPEFYVVQTSSTKTGNNVAKLEEKVNKIKCVAVYNNQETPGECTIYNNNISTDINIVSSDLLESGENKTVYYLNNGKPTLSCIIGETSTQEYTYTWTVAPASDRATEVKQQEIEIDANTKVTAEDLKNSYNSYIAIKKAQQGTLDINTKTRYYGGQLAGLQKKYQAYLNEPFIDKNVYHNFPISSIINYSTVRCAVLDGQGNYKGSASITLYNKPEMEGMYSLNLINGTQVFQYDGKGNSPTSPQLTNPLKLSPLTFSLVDNAGKEIPYEQIEQEGEVRWIIPKEQTLLSYVGSATPISGQNDSVVSRADLALPASSYDIYKDLSSFPYSIAEQYDSKKNINYIWLNIKYKDLILDAYTNFTFPKEGDPGTNGTDFVAKLVPYPGEDTDSVYVTNKTKTTSDDIAGELPFDNQGREVDNIRFLLYNNSRQVDESSYVSHNISLLKNSDISLITVTTGGKLYFKNPSTNDFKQWVKTNKPVDIIRKYVEISDLKYYAEYPIYFNYIVNSANYRIKVKPKTGFKYVVYSEDGTLPDYDNTLPFELIVEEYIGGYYQPLDTNLSYDWEAIGNLKIEGNTDKSTCKAVPLDKYDGQNLSSALLCTVKKSGSIIGYIHIPVYMCINRYGHAALNEWDGNSISLQFDENGNPKGSTILAPQMGAGQKETDNSFTGVLMGRERPKDGKSDGSDDDVGLFGYDHGHRSIFLDSKTGNATFGKSGAAQIKIDAQSGQGTIASGDYSPRDYHKTKDEEIDPNKTYYIFNSDSNKYSKVTNPKKEDLSKYYEFIGYGMKIKFSSTGKDAEKGPYIKYGSNNFSVNANGEIHAAGKGDIANWNIDNDKIYKHNTNGTWAGMASTNWTVDSIGGTLPSATDTVAFYAGANTAHNNFYVTHKGYLYSKQGQIGGWNITSTKLFHDSYKKNENDEWVKDQQDIVGLSAPLNPTSTHIAFYAGGSPGNRDKFYVRYDGYLRSTAGKIANWNISSTALADNNVGLGQKTFSQKDENNAFKNPFKESIAARIWAGDNGVNTDDTKLNFAVAQDGKLYSKAGKIGGWTITDSKLYAINKDSGNAGIRLNADGSMNGGAGYSNGSGGSWSINTDGSSSFSNITATNATVTGNITANTLTANESGTIGGWTIGGTSLSASNITLNSNGSLEGGDWSISNSGDAHFNNLYGTVKSGQSLSSGGGGGGGGGGGTWNMPGSGAPTWNYNQKEMTPRNIKVFTKLYLKSQVPDSGDWIMVKSNLKSLGDCIRLVQGSKTINLPFGGTISVPTYTLDVDNYKLIDSYNTLNNDKIVYGWGDNETETYSVMCSTLSDATAGESV